MEQCGARTCSDGYFTDGRVAAWIADHWLDWPRGVWLPFCRLIAGGKADPNRRSLSRGYRLISSDRRKAEIDQDAVQAAERDTSVASAMFASCDRSIPLRSACRLLSRTRGSNSLNLRTTQP